MKLTLLPLAILALLIVRCGSDSSDNGEEQTPQYTISGSIENLDSGYVYLEQRIDQEYQKIDSVSADSSFSFSGVMDMAEIMVISFTSSKEQIKLFVDNSEYTVNGDITDPDNINITGSEIHDKYSAMNDELMDFQLEFDKIIEIYNSTEEGSAESDSIIAAWRDTDSLKSAYLKNEMRNQTDNPIGPYILLKHFANYAHPDSLEADIALFDESISASQYVDDLNEILEKQRKVEVGQIAPDFSEASSVDGEEISLSDFRGNYLLIDFWASWCGPCRGENPNVVKNYNKYHDKGFNILGVSLDEDKEAWLKAIEDDKLTWPQVSDLQGWKCAAADLYFVRSIPHSVLLDPDGKIVAKNLREEELGEKLAEIYQ